MTHDIVIVHRAYYRGGGRFEYWTGKCWTTILRFAKKYSDDDATNIVKRRFHRDTSARPMLATPIKKLTKREGRYAD